MLAELGVAAAFRMPAQIFQPQQPQRHTPTAQLLFDPLPIRQRTIPIADLSPGEQAALDLLLAQPLPPPSSVPPARHARDIPKLWVAGSSPVGDTNHIKQLGAKQATNPASSIHID